jgi:Kef-type K+ transport system membrane component KefB
MADDGPSSLLRQSLIALLVVIGLGQLVAHAVSRAGQPRVVGEILAGIALGPSILGAISPSIAGAILPSSIAPILYVLSNIGIVLYMFDVGLQLNGSLLKNCFDKAFMISQVSILAPMVLGAGLALFLYPIYGAKNVSFLVFALFIGVAMSITAFPVLARILADRAMISTPLGSLALSCAAADDVAAWCLLAVVVGLTQSNLTGAFSTLSLTALYVILLLSLIRPFIKHLLRLRKDPALTHNLFVAMLVAVLCSALTTDMIGGTRFWCFLLAPLVILE